MIKEYAYAKINLTLDVVSKRKDGFHELKMIMIPIELHDVLIFDHDDKISITSNIDIQNNAVFKAAKVMQERFNVEQGARITLEKNIPIGAGLGGGSADIAATLRGLNILWGLNKEIEELEDIALELGSDTLFCLYNRPAYVYGRGENLLFVNVPKIKEIYLFTSMISVSTKEVFMAHKITHKNKQFDRLLRDYLNERYVKFFKSTYNHLTYTTLKIYPELKKLYKNIKKIDVNAFMSGSGSTFYIISFEQKDSNLARKIENCGLTTIKTSPKT